MRFRNWGVFLLSVIQTLELLAGALPDGYFEPQPDIGWFHIPVRTGRQTPGEFNTPNDRAGGAAT